MVWVAPDESARFGEATPIRAVARRSRYVPRGVTSRDRRRASKNRAIRVQGGSRRSLPRKPLIVWITPFPLFLLRLTSRFRSVNGSPFFLEDGAHGMDRRGRAVPLIRRLVAKGRPSPCSASRSALSAMSRRVTERAVGKPGSFDPGGNGVAEVAAISIIVDI